MFYDFAILKGIMHLKINSEYNILSYEANPISRQSCLCHFSIVPFVKPVPGVKNVMLNLGVQSIADSEDLASGESAGE